MGKLQKWKTDLGVTSSYGHGGGWEDERPLFRLQRATGGVFVMKWWWYANDTCDKVV
jgi:hypothetical protein